MKNKLSDRQFHLDPKDRVLTTGNQRLVLYVAAAVVSGVLLITSFFDQTSKFCDPRATSSAADREPDSIIARHAILHYATSYTVPQQSRAEIGLAFDVLLAHAPCNFLIFGLGHDSLMWDSLNQGGTTIFLEEDPWWVHTVLVRSPNLRAYTVHYRTQLSEADALLRDYKNAPSCLPPDVKLQGNSKCKLALSELPKEVYAREWDVIMIDAPKGYFAEAPGRMTAIFSAAVMARAKKGAGVTHVFLHDVDRKVEMTYGEEFLCKKYLVKAVDKLWHFEIPPASASASASANGTTPFC